MELSQFHPVGCFSPSQPCRCSLHQRKWLPAGNTQPPRPVPGCNRPSEWSGSDHLHGRHPHDPVRRVAITPGRGSLPDALIPQQPSTPIPPLFFTCEHLIILSQERLWFTVLFPPRLSCHRLRTSTCHRGSSPSRHSQRGRTGGYCISLKR